MSLTINNNNQLIVIPPEIVVKILSKLDTLDLLKCREVSQIWNQECLQLIKKKKNQPKIRRALTFTDATKWDDFLNFVTADPSGGIASHFKWKLKFDELLCHVDVESREQNLVDALKARFGATRVRVRWIFMDKDMDMGIFMDTILGRRQSQRYWDIKLVKPDSEDWSCEFVTVYHFGDGIN